VEAPYTYVRHLPGAYYVRIINGNAYFFARGNLYLPFGMGYLIVPQPERPLLSLNVEMF